MPEGDPALIDQIRAECPERVAVTYLDLGYSTSVAHGGTGPNPYGGNLRAILSYAANSDLICYLDDDNWWAPNHVSDLIAAIDGFDWAFAYRWFVDGANDRVLCVDDFQSVGPGRGVYKDTFEGFVDTNCLMINRRACMGVFSNWTVPLFGDGTGEDRRVFAVPRQGYSVAWTGKPSVFYRLHAGRGVSPAREQVFEQRGITMAEPQSKMDNHVTRQNAIVHGYLRDHLVRKLNIGSGTNVLAGWLCTDVMPQVPSVFAMNARAPFPFTANAFDYVVSEHMIEHLSFRDGFAMLRECHRVLKPGGRIRIATPDLHRFVGLFAPDLTDLQARYLNWIMETFVPEVAGASPAMVLNNLFHNWGHRFIYDQAILAKLLRAAGFEGLQRFRPGESEDAELRGIERHGQVIGDEELNAYETLVIEAVKPGTE